MNPTSQSAQDRREPVSGIFVPDWQSSPKNLGLIAAVNQILSQGLHQFHQPAGSRACQPCAEEPDLPLLLKSSLNLLAREIQLPFLLLSIYSDRQAIIVESSTVHSTRQDSNQCPTQDSKPSAKKMPHRQSYRHSYRMGEGIIGMVMERGQPYFCPDIHKAPEFLNKTGLKEQFAGNAVGFLCLPIRQNERTNERTIGTLSTGLFYTEDSLVLADPPPAGSPADFPAKCLRYPLASPVFGSIGELGYFLQVVCDQLAYTVQLRIELEQEHQRLERANAVLRQRSSQSESLQCIVGRSSVMQELFLHITQVAKVETTVLIRGESGTGKELVARAVHQDSHRAKKPFVSVNCAVLPEGIIDSELFGHVKGAFTGALQARKGCFELAEGGTLFLDEISELPLHLQSKLLRVLQEREYQPLGSEAPKRADVRIIAASNHNLEQDIQQKTFRQDLFFRLSVFPLHLPPLRERKSDITLLVDHFLEKHSARLGVQVLRVADSAIHLLMSYHWPGNVRELENVIERASILCEEGVIYAHHLPPTLQSGQSSHTSLRYTLREAVERLEQDMLYEALKENKGNMRLAARQLGITERQIGLRMKRYDLSYKEFR